MPTQILALLLIASTCLSVSAEGRVWTDASGQYSIEADLIAANEETVVLRRADHDLVEMPIASLSQPDQEYLKSKEAGETQRELADRPQTWTLQDGSAIEARVVDYAHREVTLQRRRGRIYVNDRNFDNLPEFYQTLIPKLVAQQENLRRSNRQALETWLVRQRGQPRIFLVDGVVLEVADGDEYVVPFSMFSQEDQSVLMPGWKDWLAQIESEHWESAQNQAFLLKSLAAARQQDAQVKRQIAKLQLKMQAVQAGVTSLWEVTLYPAAGQGGWPLWVVVPGRDSRQATLAALESNPGYVAGPVRRVSGF